MLSVSPGMGAGQAGDYFSREDYYLKGADQGAVSQWHGKGAEALGLTGPLREEEFRALCRGETPQGLRIVAPKLTRDRESGELVATHRAGKDCTFSAPKSVSIAYAVGVDAVKEAHDAAVLSVLGHLEEHYGHYRTPEGIRTGGIVAAKFDHATSRSVDPQLHSHVFLVNAVRTAEGEWRAHEPRAIIQDVKSLGLLYRQELARELLARGFRIEIQDRSQMFFELKGIDPRLVRYFSSRRREIEERVKLWREQGRFPEVSHGKLYEMAALETRDPKRALSRQDVERIFEHGFESCGVSIETVKRQLEESRLLSPAPPDQTAARVVELAAHDLSEREAVLDRARLLDQAVLISGGRHGIVDLNAAIEAGAPGLVRLGQDARGREYYTTSAMLELEAGNLERVRGLAAAPFAGAVGERELAEFRERLAAEGIRLTAGQRAEFERELAGKSSFLLTVGDPGTAKTSTLGFIDRFNEEVLKPQGREQFAINIACTGKAAREMALATGRPGFTLDSFVNAYSASKFDLQREIPDTPLLDHSGERILIPDGVPVVLRVDEASFLGAKQARELLQVVQELREKGVPVKLHLLGDTKQMQAVQAGDLLRQVQELGARGELEYTHLTEILRQRDPGLLEIARGLNREDRPLAENAREALASLARRHQLTEIPDRDQLMRAAVQHYLEQSRQPSRIPERAAAGERQSVLMVAATNAERRELNREVRSARVRAGEIGEGTTFAVLAPVPQGITVDGYRPGDTLHFCGVRGADGRMQSWGARLGTEGTVTGIDRERNFVQVSYSFRTRKEGREVTRTVTKSFAAVELQGRTTLMREEERQFAVGDRVVALKNDRQLDLQNGALGIIRELDQEGRALLDLGQRTVTVDLTRYRHLDHAYAVTIHKSQGATVEHSIMFATVKPEGERTVPTPDQPTPPQHYGRASYNALNVAVTRGQFGTHVFTNSIEGLTRSVQSVDAKSSTIGSEPGRSRREQLPPAGPAHSMAPPSSDLGEQIRRLGRSVQPPDHSMRRLHLEGLKVLQVPAAAPALPSPQREILPLTGPGRQLELTPPKLPGLGLEK